MIASTQTNHPLASVKSPSKSQAAAEQAYAKLKSSGLRITQPRRAILSELIRRGQPTSIEQVHGELSGNNDCDLVTVYRCMAAFEEIGLVRRAYFNNGTSLYEINLGEPTRYHVVCKRTNQVSELDAESSAELRQLLHRVEDKLRANGYTDVGHIVEFLGVSPPPARLAFQPSSIMSVR